MDSWKNQDVSRLASNGRLANRQSDQNATPERLLERRPVDVRWTASSATNQTAGKRIMVAHDEARRSDDAQHMQATGAAQVDPRKKAPDWRHAESSRCLRRWGGQSPKITRAMTSAPANSPSSPLLRQPAHSALQLYLTSKQNKVKQNTSLNQHHGQDQGIRQQEARPKVPAGRQC